MSFISSEDTLGVDTTWAGRQRQSYRSSFSSRSSSQRSSVSEESHDLVLSVPKLSRTPTSILYNRSRMRPSNLAMSPDSVSYKVSCDCMLILESCPF